MGLNAIGRGLLTVEDSTLCGNSLISFRGDYGSTWRKAPSLFAIAVGFRPAEEVCTPQMFGVRNDGTHDFGYPCFMPREITIDGLYIDDSKHPKGYEGLYLFSNPGGRAPEDSPFPYARCKDGDDSGTDDG